MPGTTGRVNFDSAAALTTHQIMGPSLLRSKIIFFAPFQGRVTISDNPVSGDGNGISLVPGQAPLVLTAALHGDIVKRPWHALNAGVLAPVSWVEGFG